MGTYFHVNLSGGSKFSFPSLFDSYRELLLTFTASILHVQALDLYDVDDIKT